MWWRGVGGRGGPWTSIKDWSTPRRPRVVAPTRPTPASRSAPHYSVSRGRVYAGCNVENVSYGLSSCAERNAVFRAVGDGERHFTAIVVVTAAATPTPPCGACRQVLSEFAAGGDMDVLMVTTGGIRKTRRLSALLPESFSSFERA